MIKVLDFGFKIKLSGSKKYIKLVKMYIIKIQRCTYNNVTPCRDLSILKFVCYTKEIAFRVCRERMFIVLYFKISSTQFENI